MEQPSRALSRPTVPDKVGTEQINAVPGSVMCVTPLAGSSVALAPATSARTKKVGADAGQTGCRPTSWAYHERHLEFVSFLN